MKNAMPHCDRHRNFSDRDLDPPPVRAPLDGVPSSQTLVLVVDDTPSNIHLMRTVLANAGYAVLAASDGPMALKLARTLQPQLILLDVMMPGMDGYAVCTQLMAQESTRDIPIIFVTAMNDAEAETRGLSLGAADFIARPIHVPVLLARVKTHVTLYGQRKSLAGMFRDVIEFAPDAFILADPQGRIVQINAQAEQLFGYRREELLGQAVEVLLPKALRERHINVRTQYVREPDYKAMNVGVPCLRKDGSEFPGEISLTPMQTNRGTLLMAVVRDMGERQKFQLELGASRQRLRELVAQNEATRESERKHIAREVHDELGQTLTALRMNLSLLDMRFGALDPALGDTVVGMKALVDRAIQGVRNVAMNLRPSALDMGLVAAIEWLCSEFSRHTGVACLLHTREESIRLDETRSVVVFRIAQESLTNITRYAQASQVDITLERLGNELRVEIRDNGQGFDLVEASQKKSFGLLGIRERALALGGQVHIDSSPGQGTVIGVTLALDTTKEAP